MLDAYKSGWWCASIAVGVVGIWTVYALVNKPVVLHSPGEWNCACGSMYIKTTFQVIWNPFRDRLPEALADTFLSNLRANKCFVGPELCRVSLPGRRVSEWRLSYREDEGATTSLYYKLTKYGGEVNELRGVGAISLRRNVDGWHIIGYDAYF